MARYRVDNIADLARQMFFTPCGVRAAQLDRAEELTYLVEPRKAYPLDFVIFKITEYRPKMGGEDLLAGSALIHDLCLLVEQVSESLALRVSEAGQPVLGIEDICARVNVTSKTVQRWRKLGLVSRSFIFADGRNRVGFLLSSVERFLSRHERTLSASGNFSQIGPAENLAILRHWCRLAGMGLSENEITRRIARQVRRSPLAVLHTLKKHDADNPLVAVLPLAATPLEVDERAAMVQGYVAGQSLTELARHAGRPRATVYQALLEHRIHLCLEQRVRFFDDPLYHGADAAGIVASLARQEDIVGKTSPEQLRVPRDVPGFLHDYCRTPPLTPAQERALFLKYNYRKFLFVQARRRVDPETVHMRNLESLEQRLRDAEEIKNQIVRANLRLVVSLARKQLRPGLELGELLSDGSVILMRAVDAFDVHRGFRFSTYATLALMKGFARSVPLMFSGLRHSEGAGQAIEALVDPRPTRGVESMVREDELRSLLARLDDRERVVLTHHFGLAGAPAMSTYNEVARRLGLSRERVRQIELLALAKLRNAAGAFDH
jgi:RNA polymerase primary sigma factor